MVCQLDEKKCDSNLKAYKVRKGDVRYAWLFSTVYRLWKKAGN